MAAPSSPLSAPRSVEYDTAETAGVTFIALTALASALAILYLFTVQRPKAKTFRNNHIFGYFICLLVANMIQTTGTIIDFHWIAKRGVKDGGICSFQGTMKQAGNISTSFWSLIISIHVFLLLFFRIKSNRVTFITIIFLIWSVTLGIVLIGRFVLREKGLGPYFGIAGQWCDVTANYQTERIFLECFFVLLTIAVSFVLFSLVFLRVRGILSITKDKKWVFVPTDKTLKELQLVANEMIANDSMLKIARKMVWYPVSYTAVMLPMTLIRILEFKYGVPFALTVMSGIVFNSMGLINVILMSYITREFKRLDKFALPQPSSGRRLSGSLEKIGALHISEAANLPDENPLRHSVVHLSLVDLPTEPGNTYIAPSSWKTAHRRMEY